MCATPVHIIIDRDLTDLTVQASDRHQEVVHTTQNHQVWDATTNKWTNAGQFGIGHQLASPSGATATASDVKNFTGSQAMYNLTVADIHTYYVVAGSTPVLVHNTGCSGLDDLAGMRSELGLGQAGPGNSTLTRLDIDGQSFYGISAHGQPVNLRVNPISATHAETDVFQQAANAGVQGRTGTLYVDYPTGLCGACGTNGAVKSMAKQLGLDSVTVVYPGGSYVITVG